ncbi:hypothetical protein ACVBE9_02710 [Eionea flava]
MTQIYITIGIVVIVAALVCYIFVKQTIGERKLERERLQRALDKRAKDLLQALSVFPENFLPKELTVFLYRCIIDAYEQLTKLAPSETRYIEALKIHTVQLEASIRKPDTHQTQDLQAASQIAEFKQYLNLIGQFLQKSMQRGQITQKQHAHYRSLLKELVVMLTVNGHTLSAQQAIESQKAKLAVHYYDLAKKLLTKETPAGFSEKIQQINARIEPLQLQVDSEEQQAQEQNKNPHTEAQTGQEEDKSQWDAFEEDAGWKKKNVYD